jgi:hypothetical protein
MFESIGDKAMIKKVSCHHQGKALVVHEIGKKLNCSQEN